MRALPCLVLPLLFLVTAPEPCAQDFFGEVQIELRLLRGKTDRARVFKKLGGRRKKAVRASLDWLLAHQDKTGAWDCDEFSKHDPEKERAKAGAGAEQHDVAVTGLAALALMAGGDMSEGTGDFEAVERALDWLVSGQDGKLGLLSQPTGHEYLYHHAIGTIALCEALAVHGREDLRASAQKAIECCAKARNPHGAWRYDMPPLGDNDTSMTVWMVTALRSGFEAGIEVQQASFDGAIAWIDNVTTADTGVVGYDSEGSASARLVGINDHYPSEGMTETMTAAGLFARFASGQERGKNTIHHKHAARIEALPPTWSKDGYSCDMYYWYYGSLAMHQMGKKSWKAWSKALEGAVISEQVTKKAAKGSWDPVGPWGQAGGRVYSTAIVCLALLSDVRYQALTQ